MKKTYIRFFRHIEDKIPATSHPADIGSPEETQLIKDWLLGWPGGKVDYVRLKV